jgi:hypothetical protein
MRSVSGILSPSGAERQTMAANYPFNKLGSPNILIPTSDTAVDALDPAQREEGEGRECRCHFPDTVAQGILICKECGGRVSGYNMNGPSGNV